MIIIVVGLFGLIPGAKQEAVLPTQMPCSGDPYQTGLASWYGEAFQGRPMSNKKPFDMNGRTVAHRMLPLGTHVCVRNPKNGHQVFATVTDRGPYKKPGIAKVRIVDLSRQVAEDLDLVESGLGNVEIYVL